METTELVTEQENKTLSKVISVTPIVLAIVGVYSLIRRAIDKGFHVEASYKDAHLKIDP